MNSRTYSQTPPEPIEIALGKSYLLQGSDAYLIDTHIQRIKQQIRSKHDVDTTVLYADELRNKSSELAEHLDSFSIFSESKIIILKNAEQLLKKELEVIVQYLEAPAENQTLILVADKYDARLGSWKKINAAVAKIPCDPPKFTGEIRAWLTTELNRAGKRMSPKAMEDFCSRIELDYFSAANELAKLLLLAGERATITEQDIDQSLGTTRTGTKIDFLRALGRKNAKAALEAVELMLEAEWEPLQVFFQISSFYNVLYKIALLRAKGISDMEIISKHIGEVFQSQRKEYLDFASAYKQAELERILEILLETDSRLKSSIVEKNVELSVALMKILG